MRWLAVPDWEGLYEVSDEGQVRSLPSATDRRRKGKILKQTPQYRGHLQVNLHFCGHNEVRYVHRLVLEAFVGPCPEGMECRHLDGDPANNELENLCWGTIEENQADRVLHGGGSVGANNGNAKIDEDTVREIRRIRIRENLSGRKIAKRLNLSYYIVQDVLSGKRWGHVA